MPRDSRGRYTARRPRLVGAGRRFRIRDAVYTGDPVGNVTTGEPIVLGGPSEEPAPAKTTTKTTTTTDR